MNAGGRSRKATDDEIVTVVADRYAAGDRLPNGGVPIDVVADELEIAPSTASEHLNRLADQGQLDQVLGLGTTGPQETYALVEVTTDE